MLPRLWLIMVNVDLQAKAEFSTVGVGPADGTPCLVATLPTASSITSASESVKPLQ